LNWVDIVIIVYLIISVVGGALQGLIRSVLSVVGLIVGIVLAANYYQQLGGSVFGFISNTNAANIIAFVVIVAVVVIIAAVVGTILRSVIKAIKLGWVDGLGGAVFGLIMGFISAGAFLAIIVKLTNTDLITGSFMSALILDKFPVVLSLMPSEFDIIQSFFK
jgi:membrane protein required for colicin V production